MGVNEEVIDLMNENTRLKAEVARLREEGAALRHLRLAGWMVAIHNDYRFNGTPCTFWLFTHPSGRWVKAEGRVEAEAAVLAEALEKARATECSALLPPSPAPSPSCGCWSKNIACVHGPGFPRAPSPKEDAPRCHNCDGTGRCKHHGEKCPRCHGTGRSPSTTGGDK